MTPSKLVAHASILVLLLSSLLTSNAFVPTTSNRVRPSFGPLNMVFGPKQALELERTKNPQAFERTITGLMKQKNLSRAQAEKRYGEYLQDPDGFALRAAEEQMREKGYKDWIDRAIGESDDPQATAERIRKFTNYNTTRGTIIMVLLGAAAIANSVVNPYVPPVN